MEIATITINEFIEIIDTFLFAAEIGNNKVSITINDLPKFIHKEISLLSNKTAWNVEEFREIAYNLICTPLKTEVLWLIDIHNSSTPFITELFTGIKCT